MDIARLAFISFLILSIALVDVTFACTTSSDCSSGQSCVGGVCVSDGGGSSNTSLQTALQGFCTLLYGLVGQLAFVMVLLSSIVFTAGQLFGAETRARMSVWANSMLIGAITGILMVILVPWFLGILISTDFSAADCSFNS
jgi:hypothetical protein